MKMYYKKIVKYVPVKKKYKRKSYKRKSYKKKSYKRW